MKYLSLVGCVVMASAVMSYGDILMIEDFEDATVAYTATPAEFVGTADSDYWTSTFNNTITSAAVFSNIQGVNFFAAQDTDGAGGPGATTLTLDWTGINISSYFNLSFSGFFAEDDDGAVNQDWDATSSLRVEYQIDGGGFNNLFAIEGVTAGTNVEPARDTNFDGLGDGPVITDVFTQYSANIAGTGSLLDLRITVADLDAGDEDIAFDNIQIEGVIPEPATFGLMGLGLLLATRRRRA